MQGAIHYVFQMLFIAMCEPKMVPTIVLNPNFISISGFEFYYTIVKHKKSVGLGFDLRLS